jgi:integrase
MREKHPTNSKASIYKQKGSKNWYLDYYIELDGKTKRKQVSSKTSDKKEALRQLDEILIVARLIKEGKIDLKEKNYKSVSDIAKIIIKRLEKPTKPKSIYKEYIRILRQIEKHYKNFDIKKLNTAELRTYFNEDEYSQTNIRVIRKGFLYIFEYAEENNLIDKIPKFPKVEIKKPVKRESFEKEELDIVKERMLKISRRNSNITIKENFNLMYYFLYILEETGIRYGELRELETKNIIEQNGSTFLKLVKSKTNKRRVLISVKAAFLILKINNNQKYLFERTDGKIPDFSKIFQTEKSRNIEIYKKLNIENKTIYCVRHKFINEKIQEGKELFMIAQHCGTSLKMIQDFYADQIVNRDYNNIYNSNTSLDDLADAIGRDYEYTKEHSPELIVKLDDDNINIQNKGIEDLLNQSTEDILKKYRK